MLRTSQCIAPPTDKTTREAYQVSWDAMTAKQLQESIVTINRQYPWANIPCGGTITHKPKLRKRLKKWLDMMYDGQSSTASAPPRGSYKCGRCGEPIKGHVCPYQPKVKRRPDSKASQRPLCAAGNCDCKMPTKNNEESDLSGLWDHVDKLHEYLRAHHVPKADKDKCILRSCNNNCINKSTRPKKYSLGLCYVCFGNHVYGTSYHNSLPSFLRLEPGLEYLRSNEKLPYLECNSSLDIYRIDPESNDLDIIEIDPEKHIDLTSMQYVYDVQRLGGAAGAHLVNTGGITRAIR